MYKIIWVLLMVSILSSCNSKIQKPISNVEPAKIAESKSTPELSANQELRDIYKADQGDRQTANIDWKKVSVRDSQRQARVYEMLDSNMVRTSEDYANAAMIFQHGRDTIASGNAVKFMRKAVDLDPTRSKWLLAAAIDRDLMRREKPQIYGTQYTKKGADQPWQIHEIDTTIISDEERREYGVETLAEQKQKMRMMNKKKLVEFIDAGKSVDDLISYAKNADLEKDDYNLSEGGINSFGYQLMSSDKTSEALKIFKLNTELYPNAYNTHDSYGECLVKLGNIAEGITAYKKSLELNPDNDNAVKVLEEIDKK